MHVSFKKFLASIRKEEPLLNCLLWEHANTSYKTGKSELIFQVSQQVIVLWRYTQTQGWFCFLSADSSSSRMYLRMTRLVCYLQINRLSESPVDE